MMSYTHTAKHKMAALMVKLLQVLNNQFFTKQDEKLTEELLCFFYSTVVKQAPRCFFGSAPL